MEKQPTGRMKIIKTSDSKFTGVPMGSKKRSQAKKGKARKKGFKFKLSEKIFPFFSS